MITLNTIYKNKYTGLSTDNKPINIKNGDEFFEIDTSKTYMFDEENNNWVEIINDSGSSGGSGGGGVMICNFNPKAETITLDKTWQELHDALNSGILVIAREKTMEEGEIIYGEYFFCNFTYTDLTTYTVHFGGDFIFATASPNGYPIFVK